MKAWFRSKTVLVNLGVLIVGALTTWLSDSPMDPQVSGIVLGVLGAVNMILRSVTSTAIGSSDA